MSQLVSSINERPKGTLPSQPVANLMNSSQVHMAEKDPMNQCNVVHTLRSRNKVDNYVYIPPNPIQHNNTHASTSSSSNLSHSMSLKKTSQSVSQVHKPIVPFPNRLRNTKQYPHMDKIIEIFNQVKINVPLLDAIQQVPSYAKFLKDIRHQEEKD